jgi:outer membrane murein-binding lipoprotein Lpp
MMKKKIFFAVLTVGLIAGCETQAQSRATRASINEDQLIAQENQRRMAGRIETLEMQVGQMSRDLDALRSQLDSRCAAIEQKSETDKREMVSRLSGELDKLMKQASDPASAPRAATSGRGIEHVVQPGETLYIISKAYNVSIQTITDVNSIQDPSRLSVGQKLFIPQ